MSDQYKSIDFWMSMMQLAEVAQNCPPPLWQMPGEYRLAIKATAEYFK